MIDSSRGERPANSGCGLSHAEEVPVVFSDLLKYFELLSSALAQCDQLFKRGDTQELSLEAVTCREEFTVLSDM